MEIRSRSRAAAVAPVSHGRLASFCLSASRSWLEDLLDLSYVFRVVLFLIHFLLAFSFCSKECVGRQGEGTQPWGKTGLGTDLPISSWLLFCCCYLIVGAVHQVHLA